ncbi:MAG: tetratricopeptide repeat protein [Anaerolineaceae bacterium]|nr:tetratricopeptide repeat protein [Anaerolineaceae bacterium]
MTGNQDSYKQYMSLGHNAAWDLDWLNAIEQYTLALQEIPDDPKALTAIGLAYTELQKYNEAIDFYNRAAKSSDGDPVVLERIARLYERIGDLSNATKVSIEAGDQYARRNDVTKAIDNWSQVISFNPEDVTARMRIADLLERIDRKDEAASEYLEIAALMQHADDTEGARKMIERAIQLTPRSKPAQDALSAIQSGQLLVKPVRRQGGTGPIMMSQVKKFEQNATPSRAGRSADPITETKQNAMVALAGFLFSQQSNAQATTPIRGITSKNNESSHNAKIALHLSQAIDAQTHDQIPQAIYELSAATSKGLDHPAAHFNLGFLHFQNGEYDKAMKSLQKSQSSPDYMLGSKLLIGRIHRKNNKLSGAAHVYMEAMSIADASTVPADQNEYLMSLYEPIIDSFERDADDANRESVCDNVETQLIRTDWQQHLRSIREEVMGTSESSVTPIISVLLQTKSSSLIEAMASIRSYTEKEKYHEALETAFFALDESPNFLPLHQMIADLLYKLHDKQAAIQKYKIIAKTYASRGENTRAVQVLRHAVTLMPMDMNMRMLLIENLIAMGQAEDAIRENLLIADIYLQLAELERAAQICQDSMRLYQKSKGPQRLEAEILRRLADIDTQRLDWRQALHNYGRVKSIQPDDEKTRKALVDIYYHLGQVDDALTEIKDFMSLLVNAGQSTRATGFLEMLNREYPDKPDLQALLEGEFQIPATQSKTIEELDMLGEDLMKKGDTAGAIAVIEQILSMNPANSPDYQSLLTQLKNNLSE